MVVCQEPERKVRVSLPEKSKPERKSKLARIPRRNIFPSVVMNLAQFHTHKSKNPDNARWRNSHNEMYILIYRAVYTAYGDEGQTQR